MTAVLLNLSLPGRQLDAHEEEEDELLHPFGKGAIADTGLDSAHG